MMAGGVDEPVERAGSQDRGIVAAAVDGEVVPRREWTETRLEDGQRIEVVQAVQGG